MDTQKIWNACGYVRLSRRDGDRRESESIAGQRGMILDYFSRHPELNDCGFRIDEGFSGSDFDRPAFKEMMDDVRAYRIDCIVVKDLSRFGRDHLAAGEYLEQIFPFLGVRFISILDGYDSLHRMPAYDDIMLPVRNLINEMYSRDISIQIRSQLEIKRRQGEFIGSFAPFGYRKDPNDHNRLIPDDYAADVVRDVFRWKLEGYSSIDIAGRLNKFGIPTPLDYKTRQGLKYTTPFRRKEESAWDAKTVLRILQNPVYVGTLEQGRVTTPSYRVKRVIHKPREEWAVAEHCHEPLIDRETFDIVQRVLQLDTRTAASGQPVEPFCGMIFCGECGGAMVRKTVPSGRKKYVYYVCAAHRSGESNCSGSGLRVEDLDEIVLETLRQSVSASTDSSRLMKTLNAVLRSKPDAGKLKKRVEEKQKEIARWKFLLDSLDGALEDGVMDHEEYTEFGDSYNERLVKAKEQLESLRLEMERETANSAGRRLLRQFRKSRNIPAIDRAAAVRLLERILIYRDKRVALVMTWKDEKEKLN